MSLKRLRWTSTLMLVVFTALVVVLSYVPHHFGLLSHPEEHALVAGTTALSVFSIVWLFAFRIIGKAQSHLSRQNQELAALHQATTRRSEELNALHHAALAVTSELSVEAVLQKVVDLSRALVQAPYGALAVRGTGDEARYFVTSGLSPNDAPGIGAPASGSDLLRLASAGDPATTARPDALLVPVIFQSREIGTLYLAGTESSFAAEDEGLVRMFAVPAAIAIENARLYERVQQAAMVEERERIAREMHDGLGQVLGYVNTMAQAVQALLEAGKSEAAAAQVAQLARAAHELHGDVREAILGLGSVADLDRGFLPVLQEHLQRFRERSGLVVRLDLSGSRNGVTWGPAVDAHLLRIVQEALANVRKHARARHAWVRLRVSETGADISVEDDGCGFEPCRHAELGSHFGIHSMQERAAAIGATLTVESVPGRGTRVTVHLPCQLTVYGEECYARARGR